MTRRVINDVESGLTQEYLREVLHYNPDTGVFVWLRDTGTKRLVGKVAGRLGGGGKNKYWIIGLLDRQYKAHRLAWLYMTGEWPTCVIDHINMEKLDNRFANLREATRAQNDVNSLSMWKSSSVRRGVCWWSRSGKWRAYITVNGKQMYLGLFENVEAACAAREMAEIRHYGEYARSP